MKWWPRYPGDFGVKTRHLTLLERAAYTELLDHYYATEESLPADIGSLRRIVGSQGEEEDRAVRRVASDFFPVNGDGRRHNKRADEEIAKAQAKSKKASAAAKKSHERR